jgi:phosphoribosyl-ATP pyrophosphohydrolase/phosphoribosyl-AMP cyclohydrolase
MHLDFTKNPDGLIPAIVQDDETKTVLMLGYMNKESYDQTIETGMVTFYSRSKKRIWTKGEESGHFLKTTSIKIDCDNDTLLIKAIPAGPTCHKGTDTCWGEENQSNLEFITHLENTIKNRRRHSNVETSYVASLFEKGLNKIAQKVGEEAIELVIEAKDHNDELFLNECADLLFHYLILLQAKGFEMMNVIEILKKRQR